MCRWVLFGIIVLGTVAAVLAKPRGYDTRYYAREVWPVADKIWVSTTGDMNAAASYSPSGVPINGDTLAFPGAVGGGSDVSATINVTTLDNITLGFVHTHPSFLGDIGSVGTAAKAGSGTTTTLLHQGSGIIYVGADMLWAVIDSSNTVLAAEFSGENQGHVSVRGGRARVRADVDVTRLNVTTQRDRPTTVELTGTTALVGDAWVDGGLVLSERQQIGGDAVIDGGTWLQERASTETFASAVLGGGTFVYNGGGSVALIVVTSGVVDFSQDSRAKTVTGFTIHPGGDYIANNALTITSLRDLREQSPRLRSVTP